MEKELLSSDFPHTYGYEAQMPAKKYKKECPKEPQWKDAHAEYMCMYMRISARHSVEDTLFDTIFKEYFSQYTWNFSFKYLKIMETIEQLRSRVHLSLIQVLKCNINKVKKLSSSFFNFGLLGLLGQ